MFTPRESPRADATLRRLEEVALARRAAEVEDLLLVLDWADLHALSAAHDDDDARRPGGARYDDIGGDGTPVMHDLSLCELAIARGVHPLSARSVTADALDLRHRLPRTWEKVLSLHAEVWVARKVASLSRHLDREAVTLVDGAVCEAIEGESPARVLDLAAAKIAEADLFAHQRAIDEKRRRRFVGFSRTDEHGLRTVIARVTAGDAHWVDATVSRVAEILGGRPEHEGVKADELRSIAFGYLARPAELLAILLEHGDRCETRATAFPADLLDALADLDPTRLRPRVKLYVHLHEAALTGFPGVARVEGLGPHTLAMLRDLLGTLDVTVTPVIDLEERISTCAYEHPEAIKERLHLLRPGDQFPHATSMSRHLDLDHVVPYDPGGPPGQTSTHTSQPLTRTAHRAKTHLGYRCEILPNGDVLWTTPHGLQRIVSRRGTTRVEPVPRPLGSVGISAP